MSRVGRMPVVLPQGVKVDVDGSHVRVKGPKGEMEREFSPTIGIAIEDGQLVVTRSSEEPSQRALHGTTRALISNMITGVSTGFEKVLEVDGVGYRAELAGANLKLFVGYSHPVTYEPPDGINFEVETKTRQIKVKGFDKELVGQTASEIREIRPPEPYKGKGIRYAGERVRRKAGKSGKAKK